MFQIDNSTAAPSIPASTSQGTVGFFTDGNPATGTAPTIVPAEFLNMLMMELLGVLSAAGITPSKSNFTQLASAIRAVNRQAVILTDTGTAGAYAAANTPALTALPATGYSQWVSIAHANPGASTYSPDGLAPKPIYGLGLQALQGGELPVGVACLKYLVQAGVNSGNGAWIIIESLGGPSQIAPGTASSHAATVGQMQSGYGSFAIDTGTANTYVCNFTPAITTRAEGQPLRFKVKTANNGACTINDGLGVVALVGGAHTALQGGELIANGDAWVQWNSSIGSGSYILLFCTGAAEQVAPATQSQHAVQLGQVGHGQCRLSVGSTTTLTLKPYNGNNVIVNGVPLQLPSGGVTYTSSGLAASTLYYVYLAGTTAAPVLNVSTTAYATGTNGVTVKSGDATQTLVGMVYTNASTQFIDSAAIRTCLNWFNRRKIVGSVAAQPGYTFTNSSMAEINTALRVSFMCWADDIPFISSCGTVSMSAQGTISIATAVDSSGNQYTPSQNMSMASGFSSSFSGAGGLGSIAEGQHFTMCIALTNVSTATLVNIQTITQVNG